MENTLFTPRKRLFVAPSGTASLGIDLTTWRPGPGPYTAASTEQTATKEQSPSALRIAHKASMSYIFFRFQQMRVGKAYTRAIFMPCFVYLYITSATTKECIQYRPFPFPLRRILRYTLTQNVGLGPICRCVEESLRQSIEGASPMLHATIRDVNLHLI